MTRAQLEARLSDETLKAVVDAFYIREFDAKEAGADSAVAARDAMRQAILDALAPLLTGTCETCRHWRLYTDSDAVPVLGDCLLVDGFNSVGTTQGDFACNRWEPKE